MGDEAIIKLNVRQSGYISNIRDDGQDNKKRWRPRYNILLQNFSFASSRLLRSGTEDGPKYSSKDALVARCCLLVI